MKQFPEPFQATALQTYIDANIFFGAQETRYEMSISSLSERPSKFLMYKIWRESEKKRNCCRTTTPS